MCCFRGVKINGGHLMLSRLKAGGGAAPQHLPVGRVSAGTEHGVVTAVAQQRVRQGRLHRLVQLVLGAQHQVRQASIDDDDHLGAQNWHRDEHWLIKR